MLFSTGIRLDDVLADGDERRTGIVQHHVDRRIGRAAFTLAIWSTDSIGSSTIEASAFALRKAGTSTALCASSQLPVKVANTSGRAWA